MRYIKSCKQEHNPLISGSHIRLGTFQEYRELDPSHSIIADSEEGLTEITINANGLRVTPDQWNQTIGLSGVFSIGSKLRSYLAHSVNYNDGGSLMEFGADGFLTITGSPLLRVTCPNAYMFCLSAETIQPDQIEDSYNSQYFIEEHNLAEFVDVVSKKVLNTICESSFDHENSIKPSEIELTCEARYDYVDYVDAKSLVLETSSDFDSTHLLERILMGMFEKNKEKYQTDAEFRLLFPIYNPEIGLIPVTKDPLFIEVDDVIRSLLGTS